MRSILLAGIIVGLLHLPAPASAQSAADSTALVAAAKDYIEGWYSGDAGRMTRALHPELVKRIHSYDTSSKRWIVDNQGATRLINGTARGGGTRTPKERQRTDVRILDVFRNTAVLRVDAGEWIDYLNLVREDGRWLILNVLWELRGS